ncbi:MAG: hypothetical protein FWG00_06195, partial [Coriobacteriia bacterium]|nr:hypothetical protein [Coriobacteriia bacterium]
MGQKWDKRDGTILSHEYDIFGKTLAVHESRDKVADASSKALRYEYDIVDRLTKTDYSELADSSNNEPVALEYVHNEKGLLTEIAATLKSGHTTKKATLRTYEYDGFGKPVLVKDFYAFAQGNTSKYTLKTYKYDVYDRLVSMTLADSASPSTAKESFAFAYDKNSNTLSERHINAYASPKTDETRKYSYDACGRLVKSTTTDNVANKTTTSQYGYDKAGNRRIETVDGISTYSYYNGLNQLT